MFKKLTCIILGIIITGAMMVSPLVYSPAYAQDEESQLNIDDAEYYYVKNYKSGDCVLCANAYMIMRKAFAKDSLFFSCITNKRLRKYACTTSTGNTMKHIYTFTCDGITYTVKYKSLKGKYAERKEKIISMLKKHPEGIVGLGSSKYGVHGVLLTKYEDGVFYAADSALNFDEVNKGIVPYKETIMKSLKTIKHIWYIKEVSGESISNHVKDMKLTVKVKQVDSRWKLTWKVKDDDTSLDGYKVTYAKCSTIKNGGSYKLLKTTKHKYLYVDDKQNGKSYYYKVRGYVKDKSGKRVYTKPAKVTITMSKPEENGEDNN
ncbi:MAG: hypothetical protein IKS99_01655 [Firmicutes bacterium]|nr:hypothetical protein [Bacillota bacterium]